MVGIRTKAEWEDGEGSTFSVAGGVEEHPFSTVPLATCDATFRTPYCFVRSDQPFKTYDDRYRPGYEPFTYFFPPNIENAAVYSAPMMVAPVRHKPYDEFPEVLEPLWTRASESVARADLVTVIGYSFPPTDTRIGSLFGHRQHVQQRIEIVDPHGDAVAARIREMVDVDNASIETVAPDMDAFLEVLSGRT